MQILILMVALCGMLVSSEETEFNEPSLCLQETNPFSYSHCIKKRDIACGSGGFCGTCNNHSCQTCNGNNCKTTCNGNGCNQCPSGNCCNSQNCNVCSGMNCCNSNDCNSCTNTCNYGCSTFACRSACLQTCQGMSNQCNCNWGQNTCFRTCRDQCMGDSCYENCFRNCKCDCDTDTATEGRREPVTPDVINRTIVVVKNEPVNSNPVNISTIINLHNFILNHNSINNPINITNVHITDTKTNTDKPPVSTTEGPKCCFVVHPIHCFDIEQPPYKRCIQKRHWECSNICISVVVHLVHLLRQVPGPTEVVVKDRVLLQPYPVYIQPPQPTPTPLISTQPKCHYINQYPWIQCSHIQAQGNQI